MITNSLHYIYINSHNLIIMHCHILNNSRTWFLGVLFWTWKQEVVFRSAEIIPYHRVANWKPLSFCFNEPDMATASSSCQPITMINKSLICLHMVFPAMLESALLGFKNNKNQKVPSKNTSLVSFSQGFTLSVGIRDHIQTSSSANSL